MTEAKDNAVFVLQREAGGDPFRFKWDGKQYEIPHVREMDVFKVRSIVEDARTEDDMMFGLFEDGMGDDWARLSRAGMNQETFAKLVTEWRKHCGLLEGESEASPE